MLARLFPHGSSRKVVAINTASQLFGRLVSSVAVLFVSIILARRYGPEGYGDFVKITTFVGFFFLFADFGLNALYIPRKDTFAWHELLGLRIVMSLSLIVIALAILSLLPNGIIQGYTTMVRLGIVLLLPLIFTQAMITTANAYFQKILRYDLSTRAQNIGSIVMSGVFLLLLVTPVVTGPLAGVVAIAAGSIVTALTALFFVKNALGNIQPVFYRQSFLSLLREASPLGFALVFNLIYFHVDSVILTLYRSTTEVGIYGLAFKIFELPLVLPIFFMNAVYPILITKADTRFIFWKSLLFLLGSSLLISFILWFGSPLLTLIRPDFLLSIAPLRILLLSLPIFFVSGLCMWFIIAVKKQVYLLLIHGVGMIVNIVLNILLVPLWGYMAASWITVVSELLVLLASLVIIIPIIQKKERGLS